LKIIRDQKNNGIKKETV